MVNLRALALCAAGVGTFALSAALPHIQARVERIRRTNGQFIEPSPLPSRPKIEVIVPAYLESSVIGETVGTLLRALSRHDGESTVTVVASDQDTSLAALAAGANVIDVPRMGKPAAANAGVAESAADIIVFTDANCEIHPENWPEIVLTELQDWHMVSANKAETDRRERTFWALEQAAKKSLSAAGGSLSVVGEFMAFRRSDFEPIPPQVVLDDLWLATRMATSGKRINISADIRTSEEPASNREQWERRVRIARGLFTEQLPQIRLLGRSRLGRMFIAHKLYRVTVGATGFWVATASAALVAPPITLFALPIVASAVGLYSGRLAPASSLGALVSAIGMQAVPVAAALKVVRLRMQHTQNEAPPGWTKVKR